MYAKDSYKDITGKRFGKLTVVGYDHLERKPSGQAKHYWKCLCDCGGVKVANTVNLRRGHTSSCGCLLPEETQSAILHAVYSNYRNGARNRNIDFTITDEEAQRLFLRPCHYCGVAGSNIGRHYTKSNQLIILYNGIDRVDNTQGYVEGNVVPCCFECNRAKSTMTSEEFLALCERVVDHQKRGF